MKRLAYILMTVLLLAGCRQDWQFASDLSVDSVRVNIASTNPGNFTVTVYSNTDWKAEISRGSEWLRCVETSGHGIGTIHLEYDSNFQDEARVAALSLSASTGTSLTVHVVQSGAVETAAGLDDVLL